DQETLPRLAFGDGPGEYRAPRWPDPQYPQQVHVDFLVSNLDDAGERALSLGATLVQDKGDFRSYADPIGHPFCLYQMDQPTGHIGRVVFDCFSPRDLAAFYAELLAMPVRVEDSPT